jgi:hypothetical protein
MQNDMEKGTGGRMGARRREKGREREKESKEEGEVERGSRKRNHKFYAKRYGEG